MNKFIDNLEANDDIFLLRELVDNLGTVFEAGVEFGIAVASSEEDL